MGKNKGFQPKEQLKKLKQKINFSFEHYDTSKKYCLSIWDEKQIHEALARLKDINGKTYNELLSQGRVYHFHEVDWSTTAEKNGFPSQVANNLPAFQFGLVGINNQKARVFGGYYEGTFFIVWFDLNHEVDPVDKN